MKRAIELIPLQLTKHKSSELDWLLSEALSVANCISANSEMDSLIANIRKSSRLQYQIINALVRDNGRKIKVKHKAVSVPFNIPRSAKFFITKAGTPCFRISIQPRRYVVLPIKKNRCWQRFISLIGNGSWAFTAFAITPRKTVVVHLKKKQEEIKPRENVIGIDINSKCFAVSILDKKGKILRQLYFGKDIWIKRKKIMERRTMLQGFADNGSHSARQKLKKLKRDERNFVKNRIGEVVKDITTLANRYDADTTIEKLRKFKSKGKRFNKEVMRIPFYRFKQTLEGRCFDHNIPLNVVDAYHTSKWCPSCGAVLKSGHHSSNYSLFKCECGLVVNSDRKASLAVAVKSLLERKSINGIFQISNRRVPVNGLLRSDDVGLSQVAVQQLNQPTECPRL
jgi:IS605 OrfB family transposase